MKKILFIIFMLTLMQGQVWAQEDLSYLRKDAFLAGALSFYNPGLGQFYVGETDKGMVFWLGENVLFFTALFTVMDVSFKLKKDFGFEFKIKQKENLSDARIYLSIGLGVGFIILHIYNIIDAVEGARDYNRRLEKKFFSQSDFYLDITFHNDQTVLVFNSRF